MHSAEQVVVQNEYLIKRAILKLRIYQNFEEYMQIGRIALWQCIAEYDENLGEFEMFAYMRIKYALIYALKRDIKLGENEVAIEQEDLNYHLDQKQQGSLVSSYPDWFDYISEEDRKILILLYFEGKTMEEAARELGTSHEAMKKRKQRLLTKLRPLVKKFECV